MNKTDKTNTLGKKRLILSSATIRTIHSIELSHVAGGGAISKTDPKNPCHPF